jgi:hypothetical protein
MHAGAEYRRQFFSRGENLGFVLRLWCRREGPMKMLRSAHRWLRPPSRIALLLGIGALSTTGARADATEQRNINSFGDTLIRSEGDRIFLAEDGREKELRLSATSRRDHLLRLLQEHGPAGVKLDPDPRLIMSGGGGTGFSLRDISESVTGKTAPPVQDPPRVTSPPSSSEPRSTPRDRHSATDKKG